MAKLSVRVESFKPLRSNTLVGFVDVSIPELRLLFHDCTVHQKGSRRWVGLPAKRQVMREGIVRRDDRGKTAYSPLLEFTDKATRDAFSACVIAALLEASPMHSTTRSRHDSDRSAHPPASCRFSSAAAQRQESEYPQGVAQGL
jgi:hypothetical protein